MLIYVLSKLLDLTIKFYNFSLVLCYLICNFLNKIAYLVFLILYYYYYWICHSYYFFKKNNFLVFMESSLLVLVYKFNYFPTHETFSLPSIHIWVSLFLSKRHAIYFTIRNFYFLSFLLPNWVMLMFFKVPYKIHQQRSLSNL